MAYAKLAFTCTSAYPWDAQQTQAELQAVDADQVRHVMPGAPASAVSGRRVVLTRNLVNVWIVAIDVVQLKLPAEGRIPKQIATLIRLSRRSECL